MNSQTKISRVDKTIAWTSLWVARLAMTVLAFAGMMNMLGGVDDLIRYPISALTVAFLLKETL